MLGFHWGKTDVFEAPAGRSAAANGDVALGVEAAEHGANSAKSWSSVRLHCWSWMRMGGCCFTTRGCASCLDRGRTIDRIDTRKFWHDVEQRSRIIASLHERGGQLLNEKVVWRTKNGQLLDLLYLRAGGLSRRAH